MKYTVISETDKELFIKLLNDFTNNHEIFNISYTANTVQTIEYVDNDSTIEHVLTNYSALIQYK